MRRCLVVLALLGLTCGLVVATPAAHSEAKKHCKRHHHKHKRCHKKKSSNGSTTGTQDGSTPASGPPGRLLATEKEVTATQLQLQLSRPSLPAGSAIVEQYNAGSDPHNLILEKDGFAAFAYPTLDPGGDQRQTVTLTQGTWTLYCSLLDHRSLGMQATLTVD
jgi:plastocyanin